MTNLTKANARDVAKARAQRASLPGMTSDGIYARTLSGIHRASNDRQQAAIMAAITEDRTAHLFAAHASGALVAAEFVA